MIHYSNSNFAVKQGVLLRWRGSVIPAALCMAIPSGILAIILVYINKDLGWGDGAELELGPGALKPSQLWAAMTASIMFLVGFRTNKAYQRFWDGTTLLNQMWGEWFDAASCLFAFSHLARKAKVAEVKDFRHTLIRLMSLLHGSALEEISQSDNDPEGYPVLDLRGLDLPCLKWLKDCKFDKELKFNRVEVLIHMIQNLIVENQDIGVLKIPPPILSRVFQTISRGQVNLANCKKITYTLFPFPYAQLIGWLIVVFAMFTPIVMASLLEHKHWAFAYTVIPVFGVCALNLVAKELEMPFGKDYNDLPLDEFQDHMNNSMLMLIRDESDLVPHINKFAACDYYDIKANTSTSRPKDLIEELELKHAQTLQDIEIKQQDKAGNQQPAMVEKIQEPQAPLCQPLASSSGSPIMPSLPLSENLTLQTKATSLPSTWSAETLTMQSKLDYLGKSFDELSANASDLSTQLSQSMNTFQDLRKQSDKLSSQLGQSSDVMQRLSRESPSYLDRIEPVSRGDSVQSPVPGEQSPGWFTAGLVDRPGPGPARMEGMPTTQQSGCCSRIIGTI